MQTFWGQVFLPRKEGALERREFARHESPSSSTPSSFGMNYFAPTTTTSSTCRIGELFPWLSVLVGVTKVVVASSLAVASLVGDSAAPAANGHDRRHHSNCQKTEAALRCAAGLFSCRRVPFHLERESNMGLKQRSKLKATKIKDTHPPFRSKMARAHVTCPVRNFI